MTPGTGATSGRGGRTLLLPVTLTLGERKRRSCKAKIFKAMTQAGRAGLCGQLTQAQMVRGYRERVGPDTPA